MPNKTPLQEILDAVESGISGFGLPPLPPLSKLIPSKQGEKSKEANKSITHIVKEAREVPQFEPGSLTKRNPDYHSVELNSGKMNIYSSKRGEIELKSKIEPRSIFVENSHH